VFAQSPATAASFWTLRCARTLAATIAFSVSTQFALSAVVATRVNYFGMGFAEEHASSLDFRFLGNAVRLLRQTILHFAP
jgi:hypothetical protein